MDWNLLTKMPYWLAKPASELDKLRKAAIAYWQKVQEVLSWPAMQLDPMTANIELVHLIAWERDIKRIPHEDEKIYRTRVKYALTFAKGAGSKAGWENMFHKIGTPWISIDERLTEQDWDVVDLKLLDSDLAEKQELLGTIVRQYGRTTRRYQYMTIASMPLIAPPNDFEHETITDVASFNMNLPSRMGLATMDNESSICIAK